MSACLHVSACLSFCVCISVSVYVRFCLLVSVGLFVSLSLWWWVCICVYVGRRGCSRSRSSVLCIALMSMCLRIVWVSKVLEESCALNFFSPSGRELGIGVSVILPSLVCTDMTKHRPDLIPEHMLDPTDVANTVEFLAKVCSDKTIRHTVTLTFC